ncbi:FtsH protease activity modulator HflK [Legionella spiritensis]|uniref:Protein HflK n=1 Tax=Legionella spiritensis TaxID=452 RepID=A0A0W0Z9V2_LEGSP|nr:FtsH protease activity modulator HflK [Legionella spiritensis]KTD65893.1 protease subunit HflK [Legionella spiritensis]SNV31997.1 protease subunit HflK [Legionella spiritensis]VEG92204.1 protease subunit HflK [Legionella spiritensis]
MGWNEPDKGKDPWGGKDQPPDLDEALKRFQARLKKTLLGGSGRDDGSSSNNNGGGMVLGIVILLIIFILWALSGIFIVNQGEQAAILRFGKYTETVGPGPHWIPRIISSKIVQNVERISHYSYSAQMLTKDENLVYVSVVVQYRIGNLEDYLFNVADPTESLQQTTSSALRQIIGTTTLNQIITEGRETWGRNVYDTLEKTLSRYKTGIYIVNVSPQPARAPEVVQAAFDDAIKAREDEKRFQEQALAYKAKVVPTAEGNAKRIIEEAQAYAKQVVLRAKGDISEFLALLPFYTQSPEVTVQRMYLETMQRVLSASTKIIVDSKAGNLLYLPLDKMGVSRPTPLPQQDDSGDNEDIGSGNNSAVNKLLRDRALTRPTYRQERNG